jgi:predicted porin
MVTKDFELNAMVAYRDIDNLENNDDDERIYTVGAVYNFHKKFSAYGRIGGDNRYDSTSDAIDTIALGIRLDL